MGVNLEELSSDELFELAEKKKQQEKEQAEHAARRDAVIAERDTLISEHKSILLLTDKKIRDMQEQREQLVREHEEALRSIESRLHDMGGDIGTASSSIPATKKDDDEKLRSTIRQVMNKRDYISSSLLREKLQASGVKPSNFNKELEQWVRNGWLISKGKGNYALGRHS